MSDATKPRIQPPQPALSQPFRDACNRGELQLQHCDACEGFQFYPRILCSHCGSKSLQWRRVSGRGRVASFTIIRRGLSKAYPAPYVVALVDLEEGPRMMSNIVGCDPEVVTVGASVTVQFETWGEDVALPVFSLVGAGN